MRQIAYLSPLGQVPRRFFLCALSVVVDLGAEESRRDPAEGEEPVVVAPSEVVHDGGHVIHVELRVEPEKGGEKCSDHCRYSGENKRQIATKRVFITSYIPTLTRKKCPTT